METPQQNSKPEKKFGIVAMLDALGVSSLRMHEAEEFIRRRNALINDPIITEAARRNTSVQGRSVLAKPTVFSFGDTIIYAWEIEDSSDSFAAFNASLYVSDWLRPLIYRSLFTTDGPLLFRGAISIGQYLIDGSSLLGPAIADAAAWYNAANWIGVITTPTLSFMIDTLYAAGDKAAEGYKSDIAPRYVRYDTPLNQLHAKKHGSDKLDTWCLAWPFEFYDGAESPMSAHVEFGICFQATRDNSDSVRVPMGTELKYENTIKFFRYFEKWRTENPGWVALTTYQTIKDANNKQPSQGSSK